jgi:hypothetical protein
MVKKRKNSRRNPAASARAASERATYGGTMPASAKAASARPVAKPPMDMPLPASAKPAAKKSNVAGILAAVFGVAAVGGVAWWIFSRRAEAAEMGESDGDFEPSDASEPYFKLDKPFVIRDPEVAAALQSAPIFRPELRARILTPKFKPKFLR